MSGRTAAVAVISGGVAVPLPSVASTWLAALERFRPDILAAIQDLRDIRDRAQARGATRVLPLNHGNALSVYFADPEGNTVETYIDMPFYIAQPHGDPLDLSKDDATIMRETEAICRSDPTFMPIEDWQARFALKAVRH